MAKKDKKAGSRRPFIALFVVFGPALILILISLGYCKHNFKELPIYGSIDSYEFTKPNGEKITNKTQEGKVTLFTTIQTTCPQNCAINIPKFNLVIYEDYRKNQKKLGDVDIVSIVTDEDGNPIDNIDELMYTMDDIIVDFDPSIWNIVSGDPKQVYDIQSNGINLYTATSDSSYAGKSYLETMMIVDKKNQLRLVRRGTKEGYIRDFKHHVSLLMKQYDKEKAEENE